MWSLLTLPCPLLPVETIIKALACHSSFFSSATWWMLVFLCGASHSMVCPRFLGTVNNKLSFCFQLFPVLLAFLFLKLCINKLYFRTWANQMNVLRGSCIMLRHRKDFKNSKILLLCSKKTVCYFTFMQQKGVSITYWNNSKGLHFWTGLKLKISWKLPSMCQHWTSDTAVELYFGHKDKKGRILKTL